MAVPLDQAELDRTVTIVTPDCSALHFVLAGPASRFAALLVDSLLQALLLGLLGGLLWLATGRLPASGFAGWLRGWLWPLALGAGWLVLWAYPVLGELVGAGQTPGKRLLGLRVLRDGGYPLTWTASSLRNILRLADLLPLLTPYLCGAMLVLLDSRHRRLGDLVAGTLVVRELPTPWVEGLLAGSRVRATPTLRFAAAQLQRLQPADVESLSRFRQRRESLPWTVRTALAGRLAGALASRVGALAPTAHEPEAWLEALWDSWTSRHRTPE
ncbi:MAG: RDD family protein [Fimbriimonadaceae bacterium]|nr:RDD family protein [Fimbriimonadaceae bacterium]